MRSPALADIIGARRVWRAAMISRAHPEHHAAQRSNHVLADAQPTALPKSTGYVPERKLVVRRTSLTYNNVVLHIQQPPGTDVLTCNAGTIDP
jgi:hypothetical protein